jgi:NADH-quinone oxidoreductase subunit J
MSFFASACILFCFKAGLLGLFYVLIYVGAVAVLFLFLIMMLQIKVPSTNQGFVTIVSRLVIIALTGSTIGTILSYFISQL